jgi:hypothetical protein
LSWELERATGDLDCGLHHDTRSSMFLALVQLCAVRGWRYAVFDSELVQSGVHLHVEYDWIELKLKTSFCGYFSYANYTLQLGKETENHASSFFCLHRKLPSTSGTTSKRTRQRPETTTSTSRKTTVKKKNFYQNTDWFEVILTIFKCNDRSELPTWNGCRGRRWQNSAKLLNLFDVASNSHLDRINTKLTIFNS